MSTIYEIHQGGKVIPLCEEQYRQFDNERYIVGAHVAFIMKWGVDPRADDLQIFTKGDGVTLVDPYNVPGFDDVAYEDQLEWFRATLPKNSVLSYYGRPREDFSEREAYEIAEREGATHLWLDDMS